MAFGKTQNPSNEGKKGGSTPSSRRNDSISCMMKKRWKNQKYKKSALNQLKYARTKINFSEAGKKSRLWENILAKRLEKDNYRVYLPQTICDRICITKEGKIVFIEIKNIRNGKKDRLRPKQEEFKNLCAKLGYEYVVKYFNLDTNRNISMKELKELETNGQTTPKVKIIDGKTLFDALLDSDTKKKKLLNLLIS